jgi:SAM-dependent methyltransferase
MTLLSTRPTPPTELIWRATGQRDAQRFDNSGRLSVADYSRALGVIGASYAHYSRILDFGCGCGRVLRWLDDLPSEVELHGCDIDADAIAWLSENIPHARVVRNDGLPPLPYPDDFFDLVYNYSVFTHLPEVYQDRWLAELNRVTRPGGVLLLTVSGDHPFAGFIASLREAGADPGKWDRVYRNGRMVYVEDDSWTGGPFPDFYHSAFHPPRYIFEHWTKFLELKAYITRGARDFQDLLILRPRKG